eukprot:6163024-Prymnesium_polylepis.1
MDEEEIGAAMAKAARHYHSRAVSFREGRANLLHATLNAAYFAQCEANAEHGTDPAVAQTFTALSNRLQLVAAALLKAWDSAMKEKINQQANAHQVPLEVEWEQFKEEVDWEQFKVDLLRHAAQRDQKVFTMQPVIRDFVHKVWRGRLVQFFAFKGRDVRSSHGRVMNRARPIYYLVYGFYFAGIVITNLALMPVLLLLTAAYPPFLGRLDELNWYCRERFGALPHLNLLVVPFVKFGVSFLSDLMLALIFTTSPFALSARPTGSSIVLKQRAAMRTC